MRSERIETLVVGIDENQIRARVGRNGLNI
jgi:hypothetical protein